MANETTELLGQLGGFLGGQGWTPLSPSWVKEPLQFGLSSPKPGWNQALADFLRGQNWQMLAQSQLNPNDIRLRLPRPDERSIMMNLSQQPGAPEGDLLMNLARFQSPPVGGGPLAGRRGLGALQGAPPMFRSPAPLGRPLTPPGMLFNPQLPERPRRGPSALEELGFWGAGG